MDLTVRQRLALLPGFYINLDRSTERRRLFEERMLPYAPNLQRLSAYDMRDVTLDDAEAFHQQRVARKYAGYKDKSYVPKTSKLNVKSELAARGSIACARSHCAALRAGLTAGWPRFLIMEDDAYPRQQLLHMPLLGHNGHIMLYGSTGIELSHGEQKKAQERYGDFGRAFNFFKWKPVHERRWAPGKMLHVYCAHAYEVTAYAAEQLLEVWDSPGDSIDVEWWPVLTSVETWQAKPPVIVQDVSLSRDIRDGAMYLHRSAGTRSARVDGDGDTFSADGATEIQAGQRVLPLGREVAGEVVKMDATNPSYCYVLFDGETRAKVRSTRVLKILAEKMTMPRFLHRVWVGDKDEWVDEYGRALAEANPDWRVVEWGADELREHAGFTEREHAIVDQLLSVKPRDRDRNRYRAVSDLARLAIVDTHGGIYVDSDMLPGPRSVTETFEGVECAVVQETKGKVCNAVIAATPAHPFVHEYRVVVADALESALATGRAFNPVYVTGPPVMTKLLADGKFRETVTVLPRHVAYAYGYSTVRSTHHIAPEPHPDSTFVHHWASMRRRHNAPMPREGQK